jgi:hypothetical protein
MSITPRRLRVIAAFTAATLLVIASAAAGYLAVRPAPAPTPARPVVRVTADATRIAPAPLLIVPLIDASGSMAYNDPAGLRYTASIEMLSAVAAARPAPAKTLVAPVYFGSRVVVGATTELGPGSTAAVGYSGYLDDTDFRAALRAALPTVQSFRRSDGGRSGRAIVVILTDGTPDLPNAPSFSEALWPGIEGAVTDLRAAGGELYLLGVTDDTPGWKQAAERWRSILGSQNVLLARDAAGLHGLYRELAATALDLGVVAGSELRSGKTATLRAGTYSETLVARVTALEPDSTFRAHLSGETTATSVHMGGRGEQLTMRVPASRGVILTIENTSRSPLMVALTAQTSVLRPAVSVVPCVGAAIDGVLLDLRDGRAEPLGSVAADPLTLTATLTWSQSETETVLPLDLRVLTRGQYEARAQGSARWPASPCRLTVLSRSIGGEIGRMDYSIEPTAAVWAALTEPSDLFGLADAKGVPLRVVLRDASHPAGVAKTGSAPVSVSAELRRLDGSTAASSWLSAADKGTFSGILPGTVKDGVLRITVVGPDGTALSAREVAFRMRKTPLQLLLGGAIRYLTVAASVLLVVVLIAAVWLLLKPPLAGSLVVKGSGVRPQRFTVLGQRFGVVGVDDDSGRERWLVLPASRNAVRVLRVFPIPCQALVHRGSDVPFRGRTTRLI